MAAIWLRQSTAKTIKMGPFVDDTDGKTLEAGLTIAQADIKLSKNAGTYAQTNNAAGATYDANGDYNVPLDTTDTNTLGDLRVSIFEAGALIVWRDFQVVPANVYDALVLGSDKLEVDLVELIGSTSIAAKLKNNADGVILVTCAAGSTTTAIVLNATTGIDGGVPSADNDKYNGRILVMLTGVAAKEVADVTDYVGSTKTLTVSALTVAPGVGDLGILV